MGDTFCFVDGLGVDRASKRSMRRHVMKGKNAGKKLHRRSRRERAQRPTSDILAQRETTRRCISVSPVATSKYFGRQTFTISTPVHLTDYSLRVINQFFSYVADRVYPIQLGLSVEDSKSLWFQLLVADEASHHCSIALLQACNGIFIHDGDNPPEALHHISCAYAHIKKRLDSSDALSDSTIGLVVTFIHYEHIKKDPSEARVHVDGMRRMVELRGGLGRIEGNLPLVLKLCKTDVIFTLQYGGPTAFFRDQMPEARKALSLEGHDPGLDAAVASVYHTGLDPRLGEILSDAFRLSFLFNSRARHYKTSLVVYQEMVLSVFYRLIDFYPLGTYRRQSDEEAAYHIGLTMFMMTIFLKYQRRRMVDYRLMFQRLRDVLETSVAQCHSELALWVMVIGGIWIWDVPDAEWLLRKLGGVSQELEIESWDEAQVVLRKFPWMNCIHDESGQQVWEWMWMYQFY